MPSPEAAPAAEVTEPSEAFATGGEVASPTTPDSSVPCGDRPQSAVVHGDDPDRRPTPVWEPVISGFDREKLEETYQKAFGGDASRRHEALRTLAELGAEEIMPELIDIASSEDEDSEVRRELIQRIDWSGDTQVLGDILIGSRDVEARLAAVAAASGETLTEGERTGLEALLLENLAIEPSDGVKIATLNHFLSTDPLAFQHILTQYRHELATPEVQQYLEFISTPPAPLGEEPGNVEDAGYSHAFSVEQ